MEDKTVYPKGTYGLQPRRTKKSNTRENEMFTPHQQITIHTLFKQGKEIKEIASDLGVHRNTVKNILQRGEIKEKQSREKHLSFATYQKQTQKKITALTMIFHTTNNQ